MATAEDYCRIWAFIGCEGPDAHQVYPEGRTVVIERQPEERFKLTWTGTDKEHLLDGLTLDESGHLIGNDIPDGATGTRWNITIQLSNTWKRNLIQATVKAVGRVGVGDGDLSGTWGAEAPPKPDPDHGKPSPPRGV